jgi:UTP--glucose-1-phosphate uridylyltransferase
MPKGKKKPGEMEGLSLKAIVPAGGIGTRLRPFTLTVPKELLPVARKPMIQVAVEEALACGIKEIGIVIRKGKEAIRKHFEVLRASSDHLLEALKREWSQADIHIIFQKKPLGLGNAIYEAAEFIDASPFVMIIPDQFVLADVSGTRQLLDAVKEDSQAVWSSIVVVPREEQELFPGARQFELINRRGKTWEVLGIREERGHPEPETLLGFGRTFFPAQVLDFFSDEYLNPATGEIDLLFSFRGLLKARRNRAVLLEGRAMDFGTWAGYEHFSSHLNMLQFANIG